MRSLISYSDMFFLCLTSCDIEINVCESERLMSFGFVFLYVMHCKPANEVVYISILSLKKPLSLHSTTISCLVIIGSGCLKKNIVAVLLTGAIIDPEAYFDVYLSVLNSFIIVSDGLINWAILL